MKNKKDKERINPWKKVLLEVYRDKIILYKDCDSLEEISSFARDCKVPKEVFKRALSFLKEHNLIELRDDDFFYLTSKGFDVARDLQKESREIVQQFSIIFLTFVLALTALFGFLDTSESKTLFIIGYVLSLLAGFIALSWIFNKLGK